MLLRPAVYWSLALWTAAGYSLGFLSSSLGDNWFGKDSRVQLWLFLSDRRVSQEVLVFDL